MKEETALAVIQPEMDVEVFGTQKKTILNLVKSQMKNNQDYGIIPGTKRRTLLQPGAEKLAKLFGLAPQFTLMKEVEIREQGEKFAYYRYKCELIHIGTGKKVGDAERSCNSSEPKYVGKSLGDLMNTCQAMAQKRALVAAVRTATMATDIFVDDVSESGETGPTNAEKDPARVKLISKLHAIATPRGFDDVVLHALIKKVYGVESITELTNIQIDQTIENLVSGYKEVGAGNHWEKLNDKIIDVEENA